MLGALGATPLLARFNGLVFDASPKDRLLFIRDVGPVRLVLVGGTSGEALFSDCAGCSAKPDTSGVTAVVLMTPSMLEGTELCDCEGMVFWVNISRMFLRPSNSGISLPDNGKMSFVEYCL